MKPKLHDLGMSVSCEWRLRGLAINSPHPCPLRPLGQVGTRRKIGAQAWRRGLSPLSSVRCVDTSPRRGYPWPLGRSGRRGKTPTQQLTPTPCPPSPPWAGREAKVRPRQGLRNQIGVSGVVIDGLATKRGIAMPRPQLDNDTLAPSLVPGHAHTRYLVVRHRGEWFIKFHGEAYGPYNTEREAMRFAIDAAYKLGESGEESQVLSMDESGSIQSTWTHGQHPFPSWQ